MFIKDKDKLIQEGILSTTATRAGNAIRKTGALGLVGAGAGAVVGSIGGGLAGAGAGAITGTLFGIGGGFVSGIPKVFNGLLMDRANKKDLSEKQFEATTTHMNLVHLQRMLNDYLLKRKSNKAYAEAVHPQKIGGLLKDNFQYYEEMRKGEDPESLIYKNCTRMMNGIQGMQEHLAKEVGQVSLNMIPNFQNDSFNVDPAKMHNNFTARDTFKRQIEGGHDVIYGVKNVNADAIRNAVKYAKGLNAEFAKFRAKKGSKAELAELSEYVGHVHWVYHKSMSEPGTVKWMTDWGIISIVKQILALDVHFDDIEEGKMPPDIKIPELLKNESCSAGIVPLTQGGPTGKVQFIKKAWPDTAVIDDEEEDEVVDESVKDILRDRVQSPLGNGLKGAALGALMGGAVGMVAGPATALIGAGVGAISFFAVTYSTTLNKNITEMATQTANLNNLTNDAYIDNLTKTLTKSVNNFITEKSSGRMNQKVYVVEAETVVERLQNMVSYYRALASGEELQPKASDNLMSLVNTCEMLAMTLNKQIDVTQTYGNPFDNLYTTGELDFTRARTFMNANEPGLDYNVVEVNHMVAQYNELVRKYDQLTKNTMHHTDDRQMSKSAIEMYRCIADGVIIARNIKLKIDIARSTTQFFDDTGEIMRLYRDVNYIAQVTNINRLHSLRKLKALSLQKPSNFRD